MEWEDHRSLFIRKDDIHGDCAMLYSWYSCSIIGGMIVELVDQMRFDNCRALHTGAPKRIRAEWGEGRKRNSGRIGGVSKKVLFATVNLDPA